MDDVEEKTLRFQALIEEYKNVSAELQQYTQEGMRSFPYAAVLIAVYLGWGLSGDPSQISRFETTIRVFVPYGFVLLCVYFLAMVYVREGLVKYQGYVEERINKIVGDDTMQFASKYSPTIMERGYLQMGTAWYSRIPTPPLFLGMVITMASLLVFSSDVIRKQTIVVLALLGACAVIAIYVYLIYPRLLDRIYRTRGFNPPVRGRKEKRH
jgi:cytochrome bd-type quinol oxidase subunit 2